MKRKLVLPLLILSLIGNAFFLIREFGFPKKRGSEEIKVRVVRVIDGDTFDTDKNKRVRLKGAEAPEYPKGCLSQEAKAAGFVKSRDCPE